MLGTVKEKNLGTVVLDKFLGSFLDKDANKISKSKNETSPMSALSSFMETDKKDPVGSLIGGFLIDMPEERENPKRRLVAAGTQTVRTEEKPVETDAIIGSFLLEESKLTEGKKKSGVGAVLSADENVSDVLGSFLGEERAKDSDLIGEFLPKEAKLEKMKAQKIDTIYLASEGIICVKEAASCCPIFCAKPTEDVQKKLLEVAKNFAAILEKSCRKNIQE